MSTSAEAAMETIHARFGAHARHRALHAKGRFYLATFTATAEASALTRAPHMSGEPTPTTVRFSNGGGDPTVPDHAPDVRGLATSFHLPDGSRTDILAQSLPRFPFRDQEGFLAAIRVSKPSLGGLMRMPAFALRYPRALASLPEAQRTMARRLSFAARPYYAFHAFKWVNGGGGERFVRYRWLPTVDEPDISKAEAKRRGPDWLFEELARRLEAEPVRMRLEVKIAAGDDDPDDPSDEWPDERERVIVGTLEVSAPDPDADDGTVFDPLRLCDGIEPSKDRALHYRPPVYTLSHERRSRG